MPRALIKCKGGQRTGTLSLDKRHACDRSLPLEVCLVVLVVNDGVVETSLQESLRGRLCALIAVEGAGVGRGLDFIRCRGRDQEHGQIRMRSYPCE